MGKKLELPESFREARTFRVTDHFLNYATGGLWTSTTTGSGTLTVGAGLGGILNIATVDSTTNREDYIATTASCFAFQNDKPLIGEIMLTFTEASTNQANLIFGFMNSVAAGALVSASAGPSTNFSGAVFFKQAGSQTNWQCTSSIGTTQQTFVSTINAQQTNYQKLRIEVYPISSTQAEIVYSIDVGSGLLQCKNNTVAAGWNPLMKHVVTYTGAVAMQFFAGVKNGTTAAETLSIDYMLAAQLGNNPQGT